MLNWADGRAREDAALLTVKSRQLDLVGGDSAQTPGNPGGWSVAVRPQCTAQSILYRKPPSLLGLSNVTRG